MYTTKQISDFLIPQHKGKRYEFLIKLVNESFPDSATDSVDFAPQDAIPYENYFTQWIYEGKCDVEKCWNLIDDPDNEDECDACLKVRYRKELSKVNVRERKRKYKEMNKEFKNDKELEDWEWSHRKCGHGREMCIKGKCDGESSSSENSDSE